VLLAALTVTLFYAVGTGFFPAADEGGFVLDYLTPEGSALSETDRQVKQIEKVISETPEVASYSRRTGSELGLFATAQNTGDILVRLKPRNQRSRSSEEVIDEVRDKLHEIVPLTDIEFVQLLQDMLGDLEGNPEPIEVKIFGNDPQRLAELADPVEEMLNKSPGRRRRRGRAEGEPRSDVDDQSRCRGALRAHRRAGFGSARRQLARRGRHGSASCRSSSSRSCAPAGRVPIRSELASADAHPNGEGKPIPVSEVAHMDRANGQGELKRENLRLMASITGRLEGRDMGSAVAEIRSNLDNSSCRSATPTKSADSIRRSSSHSASCSWCSRWR
jgi:multidrug efflux pump subunit AcrB